MMGKGEAGGGGGWGGAGVGLARVCDPCGVAGITLRVGAGAGSGAGRVVGVVRGGRVGARSGAWLGVGRGAMGTIRGSTCESDGVVLVSGTDDDAAPKSPSSISIGTSRGGEGGCRAGDGRKDWGV